jgi:hypothetical protein
MTVRTMLDQTGLATIFGYESKNNFYAKLNIRVIASVLNELGNSDFSGSAGAFSCKCGMRIRNCNYLSFFQVCYCGNIWDPDPLPNGDTPFFNVRDNALMPTKYKLANVFEHVYALLNINYRYLDSLVVGL